MDYSIYDRRHTDILSNNSDGILSERVYRGNKSFFYKADKSNPIPIVIGAAILFCTLLFIIHKIF